MDCGTETVTMLHTLGLLWLFSPVSVRRRCVCPVLATIASLKGRGEQWAKPLMQLTTKPLGVAKKIHTAPLRSHLLFGFTLNCHVVDFDIGCHEAKETQKGYSEM